MTDAFKSGKYRSFPLEIKPTSSEPDRPVVQKKDENCFGKKTYRYRKKKLKSILRDNPPERDDFVPLPPSMNSFSSQLTWLKNLIEKRKRQNCNERWNIMENHPEYHL